jgi:hypothetical protein
MDYDHALRLLGKSLENREPPQFEPTDVPVMAAAFCKLFNALLSVNDGDRANTLDQLCSFPDEPRCWIRVHYHHGVIWRGEKEIPIDTEKIAIVKAFALQEQMPWLSLGEALTRCKS